MLHVHVPPESFSKEAKRGAIPGMRSLPHRSTVSGTGGSLTCQYADSIVRRRSETALPPPGAAAAAAALPEARAGGGLVATERARGAGRARAPALGPLPRPADVDRPAPQVPAVDPGDGPPPPLARGHPDESEPPN